NGRDVSLECLRNWQADLNYCPMLPPEASGRRVVWVEECDGIGVAALDHWRTFSDTLPAGVDLLLTTNRTLEELQSQLQSRCQQSLCPPVNAEAIAQFLRRFELTEATCREIARGANGDLRAALGDAESHLAAALYLPQAA
ncbi:MAG TPA: hypothetical protein VMB21_11205, partial [Candidatus Limnocylindria bacterium]|nr:hypothetical protein [Candidatus Limnocylindria bacterium]